MISREKRSKLVWILAGLTLLAGLAFVGKRTIGPRLETDDAKVLTFDISYSNTATSSLRVAGQVSQQPFASRDIDVVFDLEGQIQITAVDSKWMIRLRSEKLAIRSKDGSRYGSAAVARNLNEATFFVQPATTHQGMRLESDRPVEPTTAGLMAQVVSNLFPPAEPAASPARWNSSDLQLECTMTATQEPEPSGSWSYLKSDCASKLNPHMQVVLLNSKGQATFDTDRHLSRLTYEESVEIHDDRNFKSSSQVRLSLARNRVLESWPRSLARGPRLQLDATSVFDGLESQTSQSQDPVSLQDVKELAEKLKDGIEDHERVGIERKFVHFARQNPAQVAELHALLDGVSGKEKRFKMMVVALAEAHNEESQKVMIELMEKRRKDPDAIQTLYGAAAMMAMPGQSLLDHTLNTYQNDPDPRLRSMAGLALGGIVNHRRESDPAGSARVAALFVEELKQKDKREQALRILGNMGVNTSVEALEPYVLGEQTELQAVAIRSLRFLTDSRSLELLTLQLSPQVAEANKRAALMALEFRIPNTSTVQALKEFIERPAEELSLRMAALDVLEKFVSRVPSLRDVLLQLDKNQFPPKLLERFQQVQKILP